MTYKSSALAVSISWSIYMENIVHTYIFVLHDTHIITTGNLILKNSHHQLWEAFNMLTFEEPCNFKQNSTKHFFEMLSVQRINNLTTNNQSFTNSPLLTWKIHICMLPWADDFFMWLVCLSYVSRTLSISTLNQGKGSLLSC